MWHGDTWLCPDLLLLAPAKSLVCEKYPCGQLEPLSLMLHPAAPSQAPLSPEPGSSACAEIPTTALMSSQEAFPSHYNPLSS